MRAPWHFYNYTSIHYSLYSRIILVLSLFNPLYTYPRKSTLRFN